MKSKSLHLKNINNIHHVEEPFKIKEPTQRKFDNLFSPRNSSKNFYHDKTFDSESLMHQKYQILNEVSKARKKNSEIDYANVPENDQTISDDDQNGTNEEEQNEDLF